VNTSFFCSKRRETGTVLPSLAGRLKARNLREAFEEVGVVISPKALRLVHVTHRRIDSVVEIIFFFHCNKNWSGEPIVKEPEKFQNAVWLPMDEPPAKLTGVLKNALDAWKEGKLFTQFPKVKKKVEALIPPPVVELSDVKTVKKPAKKAVKKPLKKEKKAVKKGVKK
jgi:hypothetical protein